MVNNNPPPPPPSPPTSSVIDKEASSFIDDWLEQNNKQSAINPVESKRQYFEKQCLFPTYITDRSMCDVSSLRSMLHDHKIESNDSPLKTSTDEQSTLIDEMRKIASLCAHYKSTASKNRQELEYKQAIIAKEEQKIDTRTIPDQPPHSEFTPMKPAENALLSKIHEANYNLCLANAVCPKRTGRLLSCWEKMNPRAAKIMAQQGLDHFVCLQEREAVERCIGLSVQKVMKDII
jgi:hypothetical protein